MTQEQWVWQREVAEQEREVLRLTATPEGGRRATETVEDYAARVRGLQDKALANLATARAKLAALEGR